MLLDLTNGRCWELNRIGAEVWNRLEGTPRLAEIHGALRSSYQVPPAVLERDLLALAEELQSQNLIDVVSGDDGDPLGPETFRSRFALAAFADGGVLVDVVGGSYSRLNHAATVICSEVARAESTDGAITAIAARLGLSPDAAADHLRGLRASLGSGVEPRREPVGPFRYLAGGTGYQLCHQGRPILEVDADGRRLTLHPGSGDLAYPLIDYVKAIAPKLLFLQGATVLHGASCMRDGALLGFCGISRAGKTTTAQALARHGPRLVSEDLLVMAPDLSRPSVFVQGEAAVRDWTAQAARALGERPAAAVDAVPLGAAASGSAAPLRTIWFLDAARRGAALQMVPLGACDAFIRLVESNFLGAADPASWRKHVAATSTLAGAVEAFDLSVPAGVPALEEALGRYTTNSAS